MKLVTQMLTEHSLMQIADLIREGYYPNRSEFIRVAVRSLLKEHGRFKKET